MAARTVPFVTPEEYLEFDRNSDDRNEYIFGEIVAMPGGTPSHARIFTNVSYLLNRHLFGTPCGVYCAALRVSLNRETLYSYPDVVVACEPLEYVDNKRDTITNPRLVIEVLSPATRNYDLGMKARIYWEIASLQDLVFIEQDKIWIEHWRRQPNGEWSRHILQDAGAAVQLQSVDCELMVADIYSGVELGS